MSDSSGNTGSFGDNGVIQLMGNIILAAFIFIFIVIAFVFCHHLYAKWFWQRRQRDTITPQQRHLVRTGIDSSLLKTFPVTVFDPKEFKDGLECSVCLSEVGEGEKIRLLPKCNHGFHLNCIDMWFESRTTCPLCRSSVVDDQNQSNPVSESALETTIQTQTGESSSTEATNFPTNVLFWGNETQVENSSHRQGTAESSSSSSSSMAETSNRRDGVLVIDIPRQRNEEEDQKSPPVPTRLGSLKRLLSGKIWFNPSSPRNLDLEQGGRSES